MLGYSGGRLRGNPLSGGIVKRRSLLLWIFLLVLSLGVLAASYVQRFSVEREYARQTELARMEAARIQAETVLFSEWTIPSGINITDVLLRAGLDYESILQIVTQARPVYDLRRVHAGHRLAIGRSLGGELRAVHYEVDLERELRISPHGSGFQAEMKPVPATTEILGVAGTIEDSLFNAVTDAGESPELALLLADIFGWDLDFYTDPRPGDTFRVVLEKKTYRNGRATRYSRIYAAEYNNAGHPYQAVLFRDPQGRPAYYQPDGKSMKKVFLRSPLKFSARVSSHFSHSRFHPILKRRRPHLGTDYAAPRGTPVQTIGDGRVVFAGRSGGSGKMVRIRHANGYETFYLHLSRIVVRPGQRVSQGDRIGLVGSTGLATASHLDFRVRQHGNYRNFERLRLPPAMPVAKKDWEEFVAARERWLPQLPPPPDALMQADRQEPSGLTPTASP